MRWVNETLPPRPRRRWLLTTTRLSMSSLAGIARTLVAVGTARLASMLLTTRAAAPRSGWRGNGSAAATGCSLAAGAAAAGGSAGLAAGFAAGLGVALGAGLLGALVAVGLRSGWGWTSPGAGFACDWVSVVGAPLGVPSVVL